MKKTVLIVALCFTVHSALAQEGQLTEESLVLNDSLRNYLLYVPAGHDNTTPLPLMINLHGGNSDPGVQIWLTGMNAIADTANFIVTYPEGIINNEGLVGWNTTLAPEIYDDVGFIDAMIDQIADHYMIDHTRIYATGMSNGSAMSFTLGCVLSNRIAAIGSVAAPGVFEDCTPQREIPILYIHGTEDVIAPYEGGVGILVDIDFPSAREYVQFWLENNGCTGSPAVMDIDDTDTADSSTVILERYTNCEGKSEVAFYTIEGGGHTWAGGPPVPPGLEVLGNVNRDLHASSEIWNFVSRFRLAKPEVTGSFALVDASLDTPIAQYDPLVKGAVLDIASLPEALNITAAFDDTGVSKVTFTLNGAEVSTEYVPPYALFGDINGDFWPGVLPVGTHELYATSFDPQGEELSTIMTSFSVVDDSPAILNIVLVDADTDEDLLTLANGQVLNLDELPDALNVRAEVNTHVSSVRFDVDAGIFERLEVVPPFALFGDINGDYVGAMFGEGTRTIVATPYSGSNGTGTTGQPRVLPLHMEGGTARKSAGIAGHFVEEMKLITSMTETPASYALHSNYPNPFNPSTIIRFNVPEPANVHLAVYDLLGRRVALLIDASLNTGTHEVLFDASNLSSGTYLYRLETPGGSFTKRMTLLK